MEATRPALDNAGMARLFITTKPDEFVTCMKRDGRYACSVLAYQIGTRPDRFIGTVDEVVTEGLKEIRSTDVGMINVFPPPGKGIECEIIDDGLTGILSCKPS